MRLREMKLRHDRNSVTIMGRLDSAWKTSGVLVHRPRHQLSLLLTASALEDEHVTGHVRSDKSPGQRTFPVTCSSSSADAVSSRERTNTLLGMFAPISPSNV